jgi:hypothetical protein
MQGRGPGKLQHEGGVPSSPERKPSPLRQQQQGQRSTYADKFHAMVQEAQDARIKAAHQRDLQDRRSLSVSILSAGRAEAFVDFFMLTQPPTASSAGQGPDSSSVGGSSLGGHSSAAELPWQSMVLLQEQLVRADAASRDGDLQTAFDAHRTMAKHFAQLGMLENAVFFWKRCLQVRVPLKWNSLMA